MFIPTTSPARVAVRRPIEALQRVAARIWPPKADDDFPSPRSPEDASDLPTEAVPSQPAATSSGVSNAADGPGGGQSLAQIGKSLKLKGEIMGNEDLYIDGEVEGTVELKGNSLTVGPNGSLDLAGTMTKYWAFARGGAWRNPKPTGGPYVCEQCRLDACGGNDATLTMQAVTTIELAPADVCANCGAQLLEEQEVKDLA